MITVNSPVEIWSNQHSQLITEKSWWQVSPSVFDYMNAMSFTMDNIFSWTPDRTFLPLVFCTLVPLAGLIRNRTLQQNKDTAVKLGYNVQNLNKVGRHYGHKRVQPPPAFYFTSPGGATLNFGGLWLCKFYRGEIVKIWLDRPMANMAVNVCANFVVIACILTKL